MVDVLTLPSLRSSSLYAWQVTRDKPLPFGQLKIQTIEHKLMLVCKYVWCVEGVGGKGHIFFKRVKGHILIDGSKLAAFLNLTLKMALFVL